MQVAEDVTGEGVLRLATTRDWVSGESDLPVTKRLSAKVRNCVCYSGIMAHYFGLS
jgi:hypothetical protein